MKDEKPLSSFIFFVVPYSDALIPGNKITENIFYATALPYILVIMSVPMTAKCTARPSGRIPLRYHHNNIGGGMGGSITRTMGCLSCTVRSVTGRAWF